MSGVSPFYNVLHRLKGQFVALHQPATDLTYIGKLKSFDFQTATLEFYDDMGKPDGFVTVLLGLVSELQYGTSILEKRQRLAMAYRSAHRQIEEAFQNVK